MYCNKSPPEVYFADNYFLKKLKTFKIKRYILLGLVLCILLTPISSCKKDFQSNQTEIAKAKRNTSRHTRTANERIGDYGFLIFPTWSDFEEYKEFVLACSHAEIQDYLNTIGFESLGSEIYGEEYQSERVTDGQLIDYIFNSHKIFEVAGVIFKPIGETSYEVKWQFLLTMVEGNLTNSNYENLINGTYDANTMNKFATNQSSLKLSKFIEENPYGHSDIEPNGSEASVTFWGTQTICTDGQYWDAELAMWRPNCTVNTTRYIFWIPVADFVGANDGVKYGSCAYNGY